MGSLSAAQRLEAGEEFGRVVGLDSRGSALDGIGPGGRVVVAAEPVAKHALARGEGELAVRAS